MKKHLLDENNFLLQRRKWKKIYWTKLFFYCNEENEFFYWMKFYFYCTLKATLVSPVHFLYWTDERRVACLPACWLRRSLPPFHSPSHLLRAAATKPWSSTSSLSQIPRRIRICLERLWTVRHDHAHQTRSTTTLHTQRFTKQPSLRPKKQTMPVARDSKQFLLHDSCDTVPTLDFLCICSRVSHF